MQPLEMERYTPNFSCLGQAVIRDVPVALREAPRLAENIPDRDIPCGVKQRESANWPPHRAIVGEVHLRDES